MKYFFICLSAVGLLFACDKATESNHLHDGLPVSITFDDASDAPDTRAFFQTSANAETWEKNLTSLVVYVFNPTGGIVVERNFTSAEITAKKADFFVPRSAAGLACEFYAVANIHPGSVTTKTELLAKVENIAQQYNGTFDDVNTKSVRTAGFTMSGNTSKTVGNSDTKTSVAITLKRTVAKIAIQTSLHSDFSSKYPGNVKVNSVVISKGAMQSSIVKKGSNVSTGTMTFNHTQSPEEQSGKFNNLFYVYENGELPAGDRVFVTMEAIYDHDGDFATTTDQTPITYTFELDGSSGGKIDRNGYYRIAVSLNGLTGSEISSAITVAEWETPATQNLTLGS
ncbi:MAG: FimB/Mfa2 family fimbrial subunit [Alistipes sp.]|nr:FimB/Mfa2 family fimbrial subunit [Alistipes sp.]